MNLRRLKQVIKYGWKDATLLCQDKSVGKGKWGIFYDILYCFLKYNVWSNQYKKEKLHALTSEERKTICLKYQKKNNFRDKWVKDFFDNRKFLQKWSKYIYDLSAKLQEKRTIAYQKQYGFKYKCPIGYNVIIQQHHYVNAIIDIGMNCHIRENSDIDYTGNLIIGNNVDISEGTKILTHNHSIGMDKSDLDKGCILTPLTIHDNVWIGARAIIMPGVKEIGRGAIISADSFVNSKIPPYAIVMGNPAKIVGFKKGPEEIIEYEKTHYEEKDRISPDIIYSNYDKYFRKRWKEIKQWCKL